MLGRGLKNKVFVGGETTVDRPQSTVYSLFC